MQEMNKSSNGIKLFIKTNATVIKPITKNERKAFCALTKNVKNENTDKSWPALMHLRVSINYGREDS